MTGIHKEPMETIPIIFQLNGETVALSVDPSESALIVLRERLGLTGTKEGCGIGECGACSIIVDGKAVNSCLTLAPQLDGRNVMTVEGLSKTLPGKLLQKAFAETGSVQCGFCAPGILMSSCALLIGNPEPTREQVIEAISGNLCRCAGYVQVMDAIQKASRMLSINDAQD